MSGATSPASYSTGGNPATYIPTAQPAGDTSYQNLLGFGSGAGGGLTAAAGQMPSVNPAYQAYQQAQSLYPQVANTLQQAQSLYPQANQAYQQATGLYPQAGNAYGTYVDNLGLSNAAIGGAEAGANIFNSEVYPQLAGAPGALSGASNTLLGMLPSLVNNISAAGAPLQGVGQQILNTGFDPQSALYNQLAGQSRDASNVANAGAGIGGTPYGASVAANAQNNFNLNWQNQQLARQTQASQAAGQNQQLIGNLTAQAGNIYGAGLGAAGAGLTNAGNIGTGLAQGTANFNQLPYQTSLGIGNNQISGLGNLQNMLQGQVNLGGNLQNMLQGQVNLGGNLQSMLQGQANLGGQSFALPQQVLNDLQSYLQLGQAAQQQGLQGGQMGSNQLASGIGGGIGAANTFLNPNSGIFPNAISGVGSLFAGGGSVAPDALSMLGLGAGTGQDAFLSALMPFFA